MTYLSTLLTVQHPQLTDLHRLHLNKCPWSFPKCFQALVDHMKEEEDDLLPRFAASVSNEYLMQLAKQFETAKLFAPSRSGSAHMCKQLHDCIYIPADNLFVVSYILLRGGARQDMSGICFYTAHNKLHHQADLATAESVHH